MVHNLKIKNYFNINKGSKGQRLNILNNGKKKENFNLQRENKITQKEKVSIILKTVKKLNGQNQGEMDRVILMVNLKMKHLAYFKQTVLLTEVCSIHKELQNIRNNN